MFHYYRTLGAKFLSCNKKNNFELEHLVPEEHADRTLFPYEKKKKALIY